MADHKALPVFGFVDSDVQLKDLRTYLNSAPGNAKEMKVDGPEDVADNLAEICSAVVVMGGCPNPQSVDFILSSVCSLIVSVPADKSALVVTAFCKSITPDHFKGIGWNSNAGFAVRVLSNLYRAFASHAKIQEEVFRCLVAMCRESRLIGEMEVSVESLEQQLQQWQTSTESRREILRLVHSALLADERADQAAKIMIMLLGTYTDADAASACADATECVRTAVVDPKSFSFDHLQRLSAVKALQKSDPTMYSALELFISGNLSDYKNFVKTHPKFVGEKLKVDEQILLKKIRLLTLMSIAENTSVIELDELAKQLDLPADDVLEEFIIEAIQVNAISGKLNEMTRQFFVSSFQHRQFGRDQWMTLQKRLQTLIGNLKGAHSNIKNITEHIEQTVA